MGTGNRIKNIKYSDLKPQQAYDMEKVLFDEIKDLSINHPIRTLLTLALFDYKIGLWAYDGATFTKEYRNFWEVAAFIHDWRNSKGFVSYKIDDEMFSIMITLNYPIIYISERWLFTRFTFLNKIRHFIKGTLVKKTPYNIYLL